MKFEFEIDAYDIYNKYTWKSDFGICREYANKGKKDGIVTSIKSPAPNKINKYKVVKYVAKRNHHLQQSVYAHVTRSHRHISESKDGTNILAYIRQDSKNYIRTKKMYSLSFNTI
ncbi:hypothetical protein Lal_00024568 [Lupinus albus]|nr:hypothetical protein Lal_00024568 [Lupinus albus]